MKKQLMVMILAGMMVVSVNTMAEDEGHKKLRSYSHMLEKEYSEVQIGDKKYELEYELKNLDNFMLLEVEVEDSFLGQNPSDLEMQNKIEPIVEKVANEVSKDFNKPVKTIVEYDDKNILIKKY